MDPLIQKIKILNETYLSMKKNFETLKKMFPKGVNIHQKVLVSEEILSQAYMLILDYFDSLEISRKFTEVIKSVKNANKKRKR